MDNELKREEILAAVEQVPVLSPHAMRLLEMTAQAEHEIADLVDVVKCDSALTARVLKTINSPVYGLIEPMTTVERALAYLGERMIVCIALSESAGALFKKPLNGYESEGGSLWKHDLFTAIAAREVARKAKDELPVDLAYTSGLLHDLGKAILSDYLAGTAGDLVGEIARGEVTDYVAGEQQLLGLDHAEIGYLLAKKWGLPQVLCEVIAFHHRPEDVSEEFKPLAYAVHLGDILAMMAGQVTGSDGLQYQLDHSYQQYFEIENQSLPLIMLTAQDEFTKTLSAMNEQTEL